MKRAIVLILATGLAFFTNAGVSLANSVRNCDNNAIIFCGAVTQSELNQKIANGDGHNSSQDITQILTANGVDVSQINSTGIGIVTKDGRVLVDGKVVATGAQSVGRQFIPGSTKQGSVWIRSTSVSFTSDSLTAFVSMQNGQFAWAILQACGNAVVAQPVVAAAATPTTPPPVPQPVAAPAPLPQTGSGLAAISAVIGAGLIWYSLIYYRRSRRRLKQGLLHSR